MSNPVGRRIAPLLIVLAFSCSYDTGSQMPDQLNFAIFEQSPDRVVDALTAELVARNAFASDLADDLEASLVEAFASGQETRFNSESVSLARDELARFVPEEFRRFFGDEGGRYVLEFALEPAPDGGLRLAVTSTFIATVRGGEGPLGGRPLPSNGTLESSILQAVSRRLGL
jgi:hypothetical protein